MLRSLTFVLVSSFLILTGCATSQPPAANLVMDQNGYAASRLAPGSFDASFDAGNRWSKSAAEFGFVYWSSILTLSTGHRYFEVLDPSVHAVPTTVRSGTGAATSGPLPAPAAAPSVGADSGASNIVQMGVSIDIDRHFRYQARIQTFSQKPRAGHYFDASEVMGMGVQPSRFASLP